MFKSGYFIILPLVFMVLASLAAWFGVLINTSASMPVGIYIKKSSAVQRGDIVAACLDTASQTEGLKNHYLKFSVRCHGARPVIKQVIAVPNDRVVLTNAYIEVNHTRYFLATFSQDQHNRPLRIFPRGIYPDTTGFWLIGINDSHSWDSRYWGPAPASQLIENLTLLFTTELSIKTGPSCFGHADNHRAPGYKTPCVY